MAAMTLQDVADRIAIDDLLTRYATALDAKDWDLFSTCFTPDAFIDYTAAGGIKGKFPEVRAWLAQVMAGFPMTQHLVTNRVVQVTGDTATCRAALFNPMGVKDGDSLAVFLEGGYYRDKLVRTPEGWRIAERIEEPTYSTRFHRIIARTLDVRPAE
jgi:3-phenylpropionate/cinnamic acid dioxygenase small subunit